MSKAFALLAALFAAWPGALAYAQASRAAPHRIVSINLCADELLIALADPDQIASLSIYATDPRLSYFADQAEDFRHDAGEAHSGRVHM